MGHVAWRGGLTACFATVLLAEGCRPSLQRAADLKRDKHVYCQHIEKQWPLLTDPGACAKEHAKLYSADSGDSKDYQPPLKSWVRAQAGQQLVFRSRSPDCKPNLLAELMYVSDIMLLLQPPTQDDDDVLFSAHQVQLLKKVNGQNPKGPWAALLDAQEQVRTLPCRPAAAARPTWLRACLTGCSA